MTPILSAMLLSVIAAPLHAAEPRRPKPKQQTLILEFDKDGAATKPSTTQATTRAVHPSTQHGVTIEQPTTARAEANPKTGPLSKTATVLVVCFSAAAGAILAFLRRRRESTR